MRASAVEQRDVLPRRAVLLEICEEPRDQPVVGRRPGDVGVHDADAARGRNGTGQRGRANRLIERGNQRCVLVAQTRLHRGLDDRRAVVGQFDLEMAATVGERNVHERRKN